MLEPTDDLESSQFAEGICLTKHTVSESFRIITSPACDLNQGEAPRFERMYIGPLGIYNLTILQVEKNNFIANIFENVEQDAYSRTKPGALDDWEYDKSETPVKIIGEFSAGPEAFKEVIHQCQFPVGPDASPSTICAAFTKSLNNQGISLTGTFIPQIEQTDFNRGLIRSLLLALQASLEGRVFKEAVTSVIMNDCQIDPETPSDISRMLSPNALQMNTEKPYACVMRLVAGPFNDGLFDLQREGEYGVLFYATCGFGLRGGRAYHGAVTLSFDGKKIDDIRSQVTVASTS